MNWPTGQRADSGHRRQALAQMWRPTSTAIACTSAAFCSLAARIRATHGTAHWKPSFARMPANTRNTARTGWSKSKTSAILSNTLTLVVRFYFMHTCWAWRQKSPPGVYLEKGKICFDFFQLQTCEEYLILEGWGTTEQNYCTTKTVVSSTFSATIDTTIGYPVPRLTFLDHPVFIIT